MNRLKKGDDVIVVTGKDKGRTGTVLSVLGDDRVLVENVNMVKKHKKPNPNQGEAGGIVDQEAPIHASNVMPYNPRTKRGDRIGTKVLKDGRKVRVFKSDDEVVDV